MGRQRDAFTKKYTVEYSDVGSKRVMKPARLVDCFQVLAVAHSDAAGYDLDWFADNDLGWILLHWHIKIDRLPKEGEVLTLATWTKPYKRAQAQRDFDITDENGERIAYAASRWVLMDTVRRRPAKMPEGFFEAYTFEDPRELSEESFVLPEIITEDHISDREFTVTRRDTDTNDHANNLVYIEWAFDDLSDEIYNSATVRDIRVAYKKECRRDTLIKSEHYVTDLATARSSDSADGESSVKTSKSVRATSVFSDVENPKTIFCQVTSIWE